MNQVLAQVHYNLGWPILVMTTFIIVVIVVVATLSREGDK